MRRSRLSFNGVICLLLVGFVLTGCDSTSSVDEEETPPVLFTQDAFSLQTDLFQPGGSKTEGAKINFAAAALRVWPVSVIISTNLIVPVAVTAAALGDQPSLNDGIWTWSTTAQAEGQTINFTLTGESVGSSVRWSMRITTSQPLLGQTYDNFELFTAETAADGQSGSWDLFYRLDGVTQNVLSADYAVTGGDAKTLTYTIGDPFDSAGDTVRYETDGTARRFVWQQTSAGNTHDVEWDAAAQVGSITATNYNDGQRSCWDADLEDADC